MDTVNRRLKLTMLSLLVLIAVAFLTGRIEGKKVYEWHKQEGEILVYGFEAYSCNLGELEKRAGELREDGWEVRRSANAGGKSFLGDVRTCYEARKAMPPSL